MPVFIGDVLESCGGPILDLAGNKVKGVGIFGSSDDRDLLDTEFRTSGYLSVVDGDLEVYSGVEWENANSWTKIASEFSLYPHIEVEEGADQTDEFRASAFAIDTNDDPDRYSFGVYDSTSDIFRKINGGTLNSIITHIFGQELAIHLSETTGNSIDYYTDDTTGVTGDLDGNGLVTVNDILILLGGFGAAPTDINYNILLGETHWPFSNPEPLIGNATASGGIFGGYITTTDLNDWGNNKDVTGDQGGYDVAFESFQNQSLISIEKLNAENVQQNIISFIVNSEGNVPVGNQIKLDSTVSGGTDYTVASVTSNAPGQSARLMLRVSLLGPDGVTLQTPGGNAFRDFLVANFNSGAQLAAATYYMQSDVVNEENILTFINDNWNVSTAGAGNPGIISDVRKIRIQPICQAYNIDWVNNVSAFEIIDMRVNIQES